MTDGYFDAIRGTNLEAERNKVAARTNCYIASVFTPDGNARVNVEIKPGDVIEWKRNGTAGCFGGVVTAVGKSMRVELRFHDGRSIAPRIVYVKKGLHRAYREGKDVSTIV